MSEWDGVFTYACMAMVFVLDVICEAIRFDRKAFLVCSPYVMIYESHIITLHPIIFLP